MAITETGVVVTTLQGIQGTYTEQGQALQIVMDGLTPNTAYRATAYCIDNGIQSTSNTESFTTLAAGTIVLTRQSMARQGSDYDIVYTYTSTYALSSSVLRVGNTATAQGVIAGNTITYTVSGLTPGNAYIYDITTIDVYTETDNIQSSFVMPVVNTVEIVGTTPSDTSVECELDYVIDSGFTSGYVGYWYSTDDPTTDQPIGHETFLNGADTCTVTGLTAGTAYKFRATIVLGDGTTEIHSSVVSASTLVDYESQYFTITNESDSNNTISMAGYNNYANPTLLYWSVDNGTTWSSVHLSGTSVNITTLPARKSVIFHHTGHMCGEYTSGGSTSILPFSFRSTENISASGSLHSLAKGRNFVSNKDYSTHQWHGLFQGCTTLVSIRNLKFNNRTVKEYALNLIFEGCTSLVDMMDLTTINTVEARGLEMMFRDCRLLETPPDLRNVTTVADNGMYFMCYYCQKLKTSPDVRNITTVGKNGLQGFLSLCSSLIEPPDIRKVTTVGVNGMTEFMSNCRLIEYAYAPNVSVWTNSNFNSWLNNVAANGTLYKPSGLAIPTNTTSGVPTGWTTQDY